MLVVALIGFGSTMVLPLVLTNVVGLTSFQIGLFLVPGGALIALVSVLGGRVYDRYGPRPLAIPGSVIWTGSLWFLSRVDEGTSVTALLAAYLVLSASQALMWAPMTTAALSSLRAELYPHGTAAFNTAQQLAGWRRRRRPHLGLHHRLPRQGRGSTEPGPVRLRSTSRLHDGSCHRLPRDHRHHLRPQDRAHPQPPASPPSGASDHAAAVTGLNDPSADLHGELTANH